MIKAQIVITKDLEDWWGIHELVWSMRGKSDDEINRAIVNLVMEDTVALLDGAKWDVKRTDSDGLPVWRQG